MKSIFDIDLSDYPPAIEVNESYAKAFSPRPIPPEGQIWWFRPVYFHASGWNTVKEFAFTFLKWGIRGEIIDMNSWEFSWTCAFCSHREKDKENYGEIGYICPNCGAEFVEDNDFGSWMVKLVDVEWAESLEHAEIWC